MIKHFLRPHSLAACIASYLAGAGLVTTCNSDARSIARVSDQPVAVSAKSAITGTHRYIVQFSEPSLAAYNSAAKSDKSKSLSAMELIPNRVAANGRSRLDVNSAQAQTYVHTLSAQQERHLGDIQKTLGRSVKVLRRYQYALNSAVMLLKPAEAARIGRVAGVKTVTQDHLVKPADDVSSRLIGASSVWLGRPDPSNSEIFATLDELFAYLNGKSGFKGDGVTIGDIDTGYNSLSPSFAATDGSGYTIANPVGSGNFLGDCGVANISLGGCNDKVIGVYDEFSRANGEDPVSVEDVADHGSHTSSTEVGDARSGGFPGFTANISGIAPHANLEFFAICPTGEGCPNSAIIGAIDDAIEDGVVDALNLSFGGTPEPDYWLDPMSQAFLGATEAGIFVAESAGNTQASGPDEFQVPGTVGNNLPWVSTVAATTTAGGVVPTYLTLTGPGVVPADTQNIAAVEGDFDTPLTAPLPATTPITLSPQFENADTSGSDGCASYPVGAFSHAIALVSRGTCGFSVKATNAIAAGAIAVVVADNRDEGPLDITVGPPQLSVPVFAISQADGGALAAFLSANAGRCTASLGNSDQRLAQQADVLANFSLLGPEISVSGNSSIDIIKPDIAAPGVDILAAISNDGSVNGSDRIGFLSGTSMAAPHITASGALLLGLHPDWTPQEARSALMMTAQEVGVTKPDGTTPSDFYDRGSGRVQVYQASNVGLVLDETGDNFTAANPDAGGNPSSLNLASMQNSNCALSCTFIRTLRSTQASSLSWRTGVTGELTNDVTITPTTFTLDPGAEVTLTIKVNSAHLPVGSGFHFGEVILSPSGSFPVLPASPGLHLPLSVAVPAPSLTAASNVVNIMLGSTLTGNAMLAVSNPGVGTMLFKPQQGGSQPFSWLNQVNGNYNIEYSTKFSDLGAGDTDIYAADDFVITGNTNVDLSSIATPGASLNHSLASFGSSLPLHWRIYADANGVPSSDPDTGGTAVWSYDTTAGAAGVSVAGDTISLDLVAAKQSTALPAGHYWLIVYPELPCNDSDNEGCQEVWAWFNSWKGSGALWAQIAPQVSDANQWFNGSANAGAGLGLAMTLTSTADCTIPAWLTVSPAYGAVTSAATTNITFAADFSGYVGTPQSTSGPQGTAYVCLNSSYQSDVGQIVPKATVPVQVNAN